MSYDIKVGAEIWNYGLYFKIIHILPKHSMSLLISKFRRDYILQQMFSSNNTWRTKACSRSHSLALPGAIWRFCSFIAIPMFPAIFSFPLKNAWEDRGGKTLKRHFNNLSLKDAFLKKKTTENMTAFSPYESYFILENKRLQWELTTIRAHVPLSCL